MNDWGGLLRRAVKEVLPPGAFLKRDRGDALFVTDAPRHLPNADWTSLLEEEGFTCTAKGDLLALRPMALWMQRLEAEFDTSGPPDDLCRSLLRYRGHIVQPENLRLFVAGTRILDGEMNDGTYEKSLRQQAALCLRYDRLEPSIVPRGGGLYACALLNHML